MPYIKVHNVVHFTLAEWQQSCFKDYYRLFQTTKSKRKAGIIIQCSCGDRLTSESLVYHLRVYDCK